MGPDFPCIFPSNGSVFRQPLGSSGSLGSVPHLHGYYELLRLPAIPPAALRFLRLAVPPKCQLFVSPRGVGTPLLGQGLWIAASPTALLSVERTGPPRFLASPMHPCPARRPRRDHRARPLRLSGAAFRVTHGVGSRDFSCLSRLSHTAWMLPVYASQSGLPRPHATLGSGCWPALPGGSEPAGDECEVSVWLTSSFLLAQALPGARALPTNRERFPARGGCGVSLRPVLAGNRRVEPARGWVAIAAMGISIVRRPCGVLGGPWCGAVGGRSKPVVR